MSNSPLALFVAAAQSSSDKFAIFLPIYSSNFQKSRYGRDIIPYCISKKY